MRETGALGRFKETFQVLTRSLNPIEGGSNSRILETTGKLQILQLMVVPSEFNGNPDRTEGSPLYMGTTPQLLDRLDGKYKKEK